LTHAPSFDLLRVILRSYHQVLEISEDAHHLRARHRIAAKFGPLQSRRDVSNVVSYVIPAVLSQRHSDFDRLTAVLFLAVRYAHPVVTLGASKLHNHIHVTYLSSVSNCYREYTWQTRNDQTNQSLRNGIREEAKIRSRSQRSDRTIMQLDPGLTCGTDARRDIYN